MRAAGALGDLDGAGGARTAGWRGWRLTGWQAGVLVLVVLLFSVARNLPVGAGLAPPVG
ncbi:hypothetical protein [Kitasatospora fiedleri]|uniref:hypothetical protein n=1 Tax=Kitasatospora fiedleri TaxID=2991545 RepID=UPI00249B3EE3|nr:hypothetical protein [Kitasatospora fiedleri]